MRSTFWGDMPVEYHAAGDLDDLYLPEIKSGHLPFDHELVLVGERVFKADWVLGIYFVVPGGSWRRGGAFLDGGYFHKLDPEFTTL